MTYLCSDRYTAKQGTNVGSVSQTQTGGVAPLGMFVDMTGVTYTGTSYPFHHLRCVTDWGDGSSGSFTYGMARSKNTSIGAIAAHVYEAAGTYTITSTVFNGLSVASISWTQVVVTDPDTVFSGTNTLCVLNGTDHTGAPAGCDFLDSATDWESIVTYARSGGPHAPYHRILLARGSTFTADQQTGHGILNFAGPGILGAWGSGAKPIINLTYTGTGVDSVINITGNKWRVMDIVVTGPGGTNAKNYVGIGAGVQISEITILRCEISGVNTGIQGDGIAHGIYQDNRVTDLSGDSTPGTNSGHAIKWGKTSGSGTLNNYHAVLGNYVDMGSVSYYGQIYCIRSFSAHKSVVSNNTLLPGNFTDFGDIKLGASRTYVTDADVAKYFIVSDNRFDGGVEAFAIMGTGVNSAGETTRMQDVIIERNIFNGGSGGATSAHPQAGAGTPNATVRNNLFNATKSTTGGVYLVYGHSPQAVGEPDSSVWVHYNSGYSGDTTTSGELQFYRNDDARTTATVSNNLAFFPSAVSPFVVKVAAGSVTQSNNTVQGTGAGGYTTQPYVVAAPGTTITDWLPQGYALSAGTYVQGVWEDFNGDLRGSGNKAPVWDMGALKAA